MENTQDEQMGNTQLASWLFVTLSDSRTFRVIEWFFWKVFCKWTLFYGKNSDASPNTALSLAILEMEAPPTKEAAEKILFALTFQYRWRRINRSCECMIVDEHFKWNLQSCAASELSIFRTSRAGSGPLKSQAPAMFRALSSWNIESSLSTKSRLVFPPTTMSMLL